MKSPLRVHQYCSLYNPQLLLSLMAIRLQCRTDSDNRRCRWQFNQMLHAPWGFLCLSLRVSVFMRVFVTHYTWKVLETSCWHRVAVIFFNIFFFIHLISKLHRRKIVFNPFSPIVQRYLQRVKVTSTFIVLQLWVDDTSYLFSSMLTTAVKCDKFSFLCKLGRVCVCVRVCVCACVRACLNVCAFVCIVWRIANYQSPGALTCCDMVDLLAVALINA